MRVLLGAGLAVTLLLSATPTIALADTGEDTDVTAPSNDPGITALHEAIDDLRDAKAALRAECPDRSDAKCRAASKKAREEFKDARRKAIDEHHAFREEQKKAHEAAKQLAKDKLKERARGRAEQARERASESLKSESTGTPRAAQTPKPSTSAPPRG